MSWLRKLYLHLHILRQFFLLLFPFLLCSTIWIPTTNYTASQEGTNWHEHSSFPFLASTIATRVFSVVLWLSKKWKCHEENTREEKGAHLDNTLEDYDLSQRSNWDSRLLVQVDPGPACQVQHRLITHSYAMMYLPTPTCISTTYTAVNNFSFLLTSYLLTTVSCFTAISHT